METWIFFCILAYFFWAATNVADKYFLGRKFRSSLAYTIAGSLFQLVLLLFLPFISFSMPSPLFVFYGLLAGAILFCTLTVHFKCLQMEDATTIIPLGSLTPMVILVLSFLFLGENLGIKEIFSFFLLIMGGFLLTIKKIDIRKIVVSPTLKYLLPNIFVYSCAAILMKYTINNVPAFESLFLLKLGAVFASIFLLLSKNTRRDFSRQFFRLGNKSKALFAVNQLVGLAGWFFFMTAVGLGSISLVSASQGVQYIFLLFLVFLSSIFFPKMMRESLDKKTLMKKAIGIGIIMIALYLLSM